MNTLGCIHCGMSYGLSGSCKADTGHEWRHVNTSPVPCPPTSEGLRAHYQRCLDAVELEEHKQEFRDELAKLENMQ